MADKNILTPEAMTLVAARFKVLGDPMRLRILNALQDGECIAAPSRCVRSKA